MDLGEFIDALESALSGASTYYGWKGGTYTMRDTTEVWTVLSESMTSDLALAGLDDEPLEVDRYVVLRTTEPSK